MLLTFRETWKVLAMEELLYRWTSILRDPSTSVNIDPCRYEDPRPLVAHRFSPDGSKRTRPESSRPCSAPWATPDACGCSATSPHSREAKRAYATSPNRSASASPR